MKDKDVRIGMKVTVQGVEGVCIVVNEKDYKTKNGKVYTLQNEKTGKKMTINACEKLVEESREEKLEKEIREAFDEYIKNGCSWSLQTCFRGGFLAGRESK